MKFGKRLKRQIEESFSEWRDHFLNYKELKRRINAIVVSDSSPAADAHFLSLLHAEVDKFNAFFLEQEENFVIRQRELHDRIQSHTSAPTPMGEAEIARVRREVVDLHGEMVLLLNYSSINYTGLAKILKKYDKRTGGMLRFRLPAIIAAAGVHPPFCATDILSQLVRDCEAIMDAVFPKLPDAAAAATSAPSGAGAGAERESIFRNTVAALLTMQEVRSGSSTYGHFSLPPMMPLPDSDWLLQSVQLPSPSLLIPTT